MDGQLGFKTESTWGTAVTVDQFHQGWTGGFISRSGTPIQSRAIRNGRLTPTCVVPSTKTYAGSVNLELVNEPMATLLRHMFGTVNTTGAGPYTHTASPSARNQSLTVQAGIEGVDGTVRAFTAAGVKIPGWTLSCSAGELAMLSLDLNAKNYVTGTALATASYPSECPFSFIDGSVSIGGTEIAVVRDFSLSCTSSMASDRVFIGDANIAEQIPTGADNYTLGFNSDFVDLTLHDLADTEVAAVVALSDGVNSLTITMNVYVDPTTPDAAGREDLSSFEFSGFCVGTSDANAITAVLVNGESSAA